MVKVCAREVEEKDEHYMISFSVTLMFFSERDSNSSSYCERADTLLAVREEGTSNLLVLIIGKLDMEEEGVVSGELDDRIRNLPGFFFSETLWEITWACTSSFIVNILI